MTQAPYAFVVVGKSKGKPVFYETFIDANGGGALSLTLGRGQYTVGVLLDQPDYAYAGKGESISGAFGGDFKITLSAVPETSTWAMMLSGLAALGGLAAYRRHAAMG